MPNKTVSEDLGWLDSELQKLKFTVLNRKVTEKDWQAEVWLEVTSEFREAIASKLRQVETEARDAGAVELRDLLSLGRRPLSAAPEIVKQPVPCPRCGAEGYANWTLYPHQLYNSYMPGGIGHYCFPCFCVIVATLTPTNKDKDNEHATR